MASSPAAPEHAPVQKFAPFPLRARSNMEIFDAAIKLYRQYFWVLLGWSALVTGAGLIGATSCGGMVSFFLSPMFIGAVACCIAAAVRGQQITFNQCWKFTQPRYGAVLGMYILASIIGGLACMAVFGVATLIFVAGAFALSSASTTVQIIMAILGVLVLGSIAAVVCTVFVTWMTLVPIVVCLEEDKRNTQALGRAYDLLRGRWMSVTALMTVVGLSGAALMLILGGFGFIVVGPAALRDIMAGNEPSSGAMMTMLLAFLSSFSLVGILFTPLYDLIIAVYYLDLRVRKEALDLEWAAHSTTPLPPTPAEAGTMIAPNESWQPAGGFVPEHTAMAEYSAAPAQPLTPPSPTIPTPPAATLDYPPHATRPLEVKEEVSTPEYSGVVPAQAAPTQAAPTQVAPETTPGATTNYEPAASPFSFAGETASIDKPISIDTTAPAESRDVLKDELQDSTLPFTDNTEPGAQGNEPNRW